MKIEFKGKIAGVLILCVVLLFSEAQLFAQEAVKNDKPESATIQENKDGQAVGNEQKVQQQDQKKVEQQDQKNAEQQNQQQTKETKKVKDSKPDLSKKKGARPPSISRPAGNTMPKGAGKPAGITRPGRR